MWYSNYVQKKKIINFRPLFYCFISYGFAIVFAGKLFSGYFAYLALFLSIVLFGFALAWKRKAFLEFSVCAVAIILGLGSFFVSVGKYNNSKQYNFEVTTSGTVSQVRENNSGQQIVLDNVFINNSKQNFSVYVFNFESSLAVGDRIEFSAFLNRVVPFNLGKFSSFYYNNNIFYTATLSEETSVSHQAGNLPLREQIKQKTLSSFMSVMPKEIAYIAYGAMFGDASGISSDIYSSFRDSGIIHILSVSGMHMVIVVAIINFLLKKFNINRYARFSIFSAFLLFYAYLCSFNITVVRSMIMSLALIFGTSFGKRYDMLSAIGLSGLLILIVKPLSIFDIGFQLSFLSVFMIAGFAKPIAKFLQSKGLSQKLSAALGTSIAVQVGLFPLTIQHFGQFPLAGTLANLIAVPIFELGFVLAFILNIFLLVLPFLSFLLFPISFLFSTTIWLSNFFASIDFLLIKGYIPSGIIVLIFLLITFISSKFVMASKKAKAPIFAALIVACICFTAIDLAPKTYNNITVFQASYANSYSTIFITKNENVLVSDFKDISYLSTFVNKARISKFNIVVLANAYNQENFEQFKLQFQTNLVLAHGENFESETFSINHQSLTTGKKVPVLNVFGYSGIMLQNKLTVAEQNHLNLINANSSFNFLVKWQETTANLQADYLATKNSLTTPNLEFKQLNNWYFELNNGKINFVRSLNWNLLI